jgi:glycosyltransferase involved in cell wall biosynthesis
MYTVHYSFITATIGEENKLKALLKSLTSQTYLNYEIIVVDQNEHERVLHLCNNYENIKYIHSSNRGLSLARNIGIRNARGEYLVFPDDDAILPHDFLENANITIQKFPGMFIFSGIVLTLEKNKPFSRYMDFVSEEITYSNYSKFLSTTMIIRHQVFDKLNGFDEEMGVGARWGGSEETELLLRALEAGFRAYYTESLIAFHPEINFSELAWVQVIHKGYNYGLGRGALFRKLIDSSKWGWMLWQWVFSLIKSIGGIVMACIQGHWKDAARHFGAFWGRIVGFALAKTTRFKSTYS